jgi:hypothetical protein
MALIPLCTTPIAYINPITHNKEEKRKKRKKKDREEKEIEKRRKYTSIQEDTREHNTHTQRYSVPSSVNSER